MISVIEDITESQDFVFLPLALTAIDATVNQHNFVLPSSQDYTGSVSVASNAVCSLS